MNHPTHATAARDEAATNTEAARMRLQQQQHPGDKGCIPLPVTSSFSSSFVEVNNNSENDTPTLPLPGMTTLSTAIPSLQQHGNDSVVSTDAWLKSLPLKSDLQTRPGPGGRSLLYMSGAAVTRLLNEGFGYNGWHLHIVQTEQTVCVQQEGKQQQQKYNNNNSSNSSKSSNNNTSASSSNTNNNHSNSSGGPWLVAYSSQVRITHRESGTIKEDVGAGDAVDKHLPTAISHALKASITDALKRAARHFGDKLGNALYYTGSGTTAFTLNKAPTTLMEALERSHQEQQVRLVGPAAAAAKAIREAGAGNKSDTGSSTTKPTLKVPPPPPLLPTTKASTTSATAEMSARAANVSSNNIPANGRGQSSIARPPPSPAAMPRPILHDHYTTSALQKTITTIGAATASHQQQRAPLATIPVPLSFQPHRQNSNSETASVADVKGINSSTNEQNLPANQQNPPISKVPPTAAQGLQNSFQRNEDVSLVRPRTSTGRRSPQPQSHPQYAQQQQTAGTSLDVSNQNNNPIPDNAPPLSKKIKLNPYSTA